MGKYVIQLIPVDDDIPLYLVEIRRSGLGMYSYEKNKAIIFDTYKEAENVFNKLCSRNIIIKKLK